MNRTIGAAAYARVGVESEVMAASPHRLISLLFDGADTAIRQAIMHLQAGNPAGKGEAVSKALDIVNNGLLAALNTEPNEERGERDESRELADRLAALYEYIGGRLLYANLHDDPAALDEAGHLLAEIGSAWRQIDPGARQRSLGAADARDQGN